MKLIPVKKRHLVIGSVYCIGRNSPIGRLELVRIEKDEVLLKPLSETILLSLPNGLVSLSTWVLREVYSEEFPTIEGEGEE